jgi:predicted peptidase
MNPISGEISYEGRKSRRRWHVSDDFDIVNRFPKPHNILAEFCMYRVVIAWCVLTSVGYSFASAAEAGKQQPVTADVKAKVNYLLYLPTEYEADKDKKWPVIVFLHGSGERGDNLELVKIHGPPKLIAKGQSFPFIVVSPQCPSDRDQHWGSVPLSSMLDEVIAQHRVDQDRIYLTGLSMGGFGTWDWAVAEPYRFAAIAPICGGGKPFFAKRIKDIPTWIFHGAKDPGVPVSLSEEMVEALKKVGGEPKLTVYPDLQHDSWTFTYENPELYKWFLEQKRKPHESKK